MIVGAAMVFLLAQAAAPAAAPALPTKAGVEAEAKALFAKIDANGDGKVDRAEADKFHAAQVTAMEARRSEAGGKAFAKLDSNNDGMLSREEFQVLTASNRASKDMWFDANDIDRNGRVEANEALARVQRNFEAADADKNGVLSAQELQLVRRQPAARRR